MITIFLSIYQIITRVATHVIAELQTYIKFLKCLSLMLKKCCWHTKCNVSCQNFVKCAMKKLILSLFVALLLLSCNPIHHQAIVRTSPKVDQQLTKPSEKIVQKFPTVSDDSLLTLVQERTFKYFWDYAHPVSGLAREYYGSDELVTIEGSGFGVMTIPVAVERGFISREEGSERLLKIVEFLNSNADRFHGAFPHWLDGETGETIPFSTYDNGGDIVETALLLQGLLTARQYFNTSDPVETQAREIINDIWETVEWDWYLHGEDVLYRYWSPDFQWDMGIKVHGWNEGLIAYVLAASSPTHPITKEAYDHGWARNGRICNGDTYYNIYLPLGERYGGPLYYAHWSFLGLDPRSLSDAYADYWEQNVNHTKINYLYCRENPKCHVGYGENAWGLTSCSVPDGYEYCSPAEDYGVIAPTAALSSMPYMPGESLGALRYYYYIIGDKVFGEYGFCDAFNLDKGWFAPTYLAINQGPIIIMVENYRTGLLWDLFMRNVCVLDGLEKLGFDYVK